MKNTKQSFASRLALFMKGETQQSLAKRARISQAHVGRMLKAESQPTVEMVQKLASALQINPAVLLLDQDAADFLMNIQKLSEPDKREVFSYIQYLLWRDNQKYESG